ncbi:MAG TPA: hypothetical protein VHN14_31465 [Kofleriaceae bacterium]|jgi:hypothetical protein|nr:hypothetical protein [Kofleriaceae bacterium]
MRWFLVSLAIAGCASAGKGNSIIGGITDAGLRADAQDLPQPDAPLVDAPSQQLTLTQTMSNTIVDGISIACRLSNSVTRENSYYRVFALADYGITTTFHVTQVDFGIQDASAGIGTQQSAKVKIGTYGMLPTGTSLDLSQVRSVNSVDIQIPDSNTGRVMTVPITGDIPPSTSLIVELAIPDGTTTGVGNVFFIGTNTQGERKLGYLRAPTCNLSVPTAISSIAGETDMVLSVTGTR